MLVYPLARTSSTPGVTEMSESPTLIRAMMFCIAALALPITVAIFRKRKVYFKARCPCCSKELIVDGECVRRPHLEDEDS